MLGNTASAVVSVFLLIVVSHICSVNDTGIFALAFSVAQMMYVIGTFEMRNVQVTDFKGHFQFSDFLFFKIISVLFMGIATVLFVKLRGYSGDKAAAVYLLCGYFALLAVSDTFQGEFHRNGFLYMAGKSQTFEIVISAVLFCVVLLLTGNFIFSLIFMPVCVILWIVLYDIPKVSLFARCVVQLKKNIFWRLLKASFPLFLSAFLYQYIFNAPKYAIDSLLDSSAQSVYGYIVMPSAFVNLIGIFFLKPQLLNLSKSYIKGKYKYFLIKAFKVFLWIGAACAFSLICGFLFGIPVLNFIYGVNLSGMRKLLLILLLSGGFSAASTFFLTLLTVMNCQNYALVAYSISALFAFVFSDFFVGKLGLTGAAFSYLFETALLFIILAIIFVRCFSVKRFERKRKKSIYER